MRYVVISTNENPDYVYYLPLVCWAWNRIGWQTEILTSGRRDLDQFDDLLGDTMDDKDFFFTNFNIPGYGSDTISQVVRLYAAYVPAEDYFMTSDADMLPLSNYWQPNEKIITSWGHDLTSYEHYPICYIGMTGTNWRKVMGITSDSYGAIIQKIEADLNEFPQSSSKDRVKRWVTDQDIITERLRPFNPTVINRGTGSNGYPRGRVDRSAWSLNHKEFIDAHLYHGAWRKGNEWMFENIMQLLHRVWPGEDFEWFVEYTTKFREIAS